MALFDEFITESLGCAMCTAEIAARRNELSASAEALGWQVVPLLYGEREEQDVLCPACLFRVKDKPRPIQMVMWNDEQIEKFRRDAYAAIGEPFPG